MCVCSLSWCGGEKEGSVGWGGWGNRDSEKVEVVCVVEGSSECARSAEMSRAVETLGCREIDLVGARWDESGARFVAVAGFGSLLRDLKWPTFPDDVVVEMLDILPPCVRGSAD